jgi:RNA polymerase sigma-70 factor (ECF subfamily)
MTVSEDFTSLTGRFRGELLAHCYRMLGSAADAEDLVQETYLRAWRSYEGFEGRSSVRTWLYRIATNACLTALERRGRRPLPSGLGGPAEGPEAPMVAGPEVPWLRPLPDALLAGDYEDPASVAVSREGIRLAFVAALQYLSARQRAVLIMRDVLQWPAAEVAELLGVTTTAVNSGLRRARAQLAEALPAEDELAEPAEPDRRALLDRFAAAFENADVNGLAQLLREDVTLEMPPLLTVGPDRDVPRLRGDGAHGHRDRDRAHRHLLRSGIVRPVRPARGDSGGSGWSVGLGRRTGGGNPSTPEKT